MSRRFTDRNLTAVETDAEVAWDHFEAAGIPIWYATKMPEPWGDYWWHEWQHAWAEYTLHVAEQVARNVGGRLYVWHRDALLREDLRSWLTLQAVEAGARFLPDPWHPAPVKNYAAWLHGHLKIRATQHFANVVGRSNTPSGRAAQDAHNSGIRSNDALDELESETGYTFTRNPLHGHDWLAGDPARIVVHMEDLAETVTEVEREDRRSGVYSTSSISVGSPCLTIGCDQPSISRGLCRNHYNQQNRRTAANCSQDGCLRSVQARGLCSRHYTEARDQAVAEGTWTAYDTPDACSVDGCAASMKRGAQGMCRRHYEAHRRANAPTCTAEGCDLRSNTRGLCSTHYRRWRKARDAGEGDTYL